MSHSWISTLSAALRVVIVLCLVCEGRLLSCRSRLPDHISSTTMNLTGRWQKTTTTDCSTPYPAVIEFKENGLYAAESAPQATVHPVWDVGTYIVENDTIRLSTSNDAVIPYKATQANRTLTFNDPQGCAITYQKL